MNELPTGVRYLKKGDCITIASMPPWQKRLWLWIKIKIFRRKRTVYYISNIDHGPSTITIDARIGHYDDKADPTL